MFHLDYRTLQPQDKMLFQVKLTPYGCGLSNAVVTVIDSQTGEVYTSRGTQLGYFRINNLAIGDLYVVSVQSKRYSFDSQTFTLNEDLGGIELIGF
jgi:hypothetical protein